jgi:hypothetical protein
MHNLLYRDGEFVITDSYLTRVKAQATALLLVLGFFALLVGFPSTSITGAPLLHRTDGARHDCLRGHVLRASRTALRLVRRYQ